MQSNTIGIISGAIVALSVVPYALRTYQGKIRPNLVSWLLWAAIGFVLLISYEGSGGTASLWPAIFGFSNPLIIAIIAWWKSAADDTATLTPLERTCGIMCAGCIIFIRMFRGDPNVGYEYALYTGLFTDALAAMPTIARVWKDPSSDRPGAWTIFMVGYGLSFFAIEKWTLANTALPAGVTFISLVITLPLLIHRLKRRSPIREWI